MSREAKSVLELCLARGGVRKGMRVAMYIAQWTIAQQELGPGLTTEQAGEWWKEARRTWYRYQADFREIFPGLKDPTPFADFAIANFNEKLTRKEAARAYASLARIPADVGVAA